MSSEEKLYYDMRLKAFDYALYILRNIDDAEDISQNVCLKFLQKQGNILNPINWSITVAKNEAYALLKKQRKISSGLNDKLDFIQKKMIESKEEIIPEFEIISLEEAKELLSKADYKFYKILIKHNQNSEKIAKVTKRSISYTYGISYRVKRNLKAAKLLKEGYIASREIINYNENKKIIYFINKFSKKISENNIKSLHKYLEFYNKPIPKLDIAKTFDYEIRIIENNKYRLSVPYKNSKGIFNMYFVFFRIDNKNSIRIYDFIEKPKLITSLLLSKEEVYKKLKPLKKGSLQETSDAVKEIFKNNIRNSY